MLAIGLVLFPCWAWAFHRLADPQRAPGRRLALGAILSPTDR
jgi:hypothetical protein